MISLKYRFILPFINPGGNYMAKIIDNVNGRNSLRLSSDDVISVVREYQNLTLNSKSYQDIRNILEDYNFYLPLDN